MKNYNIRIKISLYFIFLAFLVFIGRAVQYHVVDRAKIKIQSDKTMTSTIPIHAKRGSIFDRNGKILAMSIRKYYVIAEHEPNQVNERIVNIIQKNCNVADIEDIRKRMSESKLKSVQVIDSLSSEEAEGLLSVENSQIGVYAYETRIYPSSNLASQVIGFCQNDGTGRTGLEYYYDELLRGTNGYIKGKTDSGGRKLAMSEFQEVDAVDGLNLYTTLDLTIQYYAEQAIKKGKKNTGAKRVIAIVQEAKTGEILAMASNPTYDNNNPYEVIDEELKVEYDQTSTDEQASEIIQRMWRNPAVSDIYEPGSTFKILVALAGIDNGKFNKDSAFYCGGFEEIDNNRIKCWVFPSIHGNLNMVSAFSHSCNSAFMEIALKLGIESMYEYIEAFKLNVPTGIELPGEANSFLVDKTKVKKVDLARMGFGHSVTFSPIQMMNLLSVLSNEGELILPTIVKSIQDVDGKPVKALKERNMGKVVSKQSTEDVMKMMEETVASGLAGMKKIDGYRIGGKTGTSVKFKKDKYDEDKIVASFLAIAPIDKPVVNVMVLVDEPDVKLASGSKAAAPIASEIIYNVIDYMGIAPNEYVESKVFAVENYVGLSLEEAKLRMNKRKLSINIIDQAQMEQKKMEEKKGDGDFIIQKQYPIEGTMVSEGDEISVSVGIK